jgi:hypothetical protein
MPENSAHPKREFSDSNPKSRTLGADFLRPLSFLVGFSSGMNGPLCGGSGIDALRA